MLYDIIIVGAGPAGLTAAIYALRADKRVLVIEKETFGGQITFSPKVENYPGFMEMSGNEFAEKLIEQVLSHGGEIEMDTVTAIEINEETNTRTVVTEGGRYEAKAVIIAAGSKHRRLGLEREEELTGEGVSYCAVCDGAFYKGMEVAVVGGGNTALQEAVLLSEYCKRVTVVQNLPYLTGEKRLSAILEKRDNVEIICSKTVHALIGENKLEGIEIKDAESGVISTLKIDGLFVAIGQMPENEPFANVASLNNYGYIEADERCLTNDPAVFVAGDCRTKAVRQITTAASDGSVAALAACRYIDNLTEM